MTEEEKRIRHNEANRRWRAKNPEKSRESSKQWRAEHPPTEEKKAKRAEYMREYMRVYMREYYANNPEKVKKKLDKYRNTPRGRATCLLGCYNFHDKENGLPHGDLTADDVLEIIQQPCAHCGVSGWQVIGLNRIDNSKPHTKANVEPCCLSCNSRLGVIEREARKKAKKKKK